VIKPLYCIRISTCVVFDSFIVEPSVFVTLRVDVGLCDRTTINLVCSFTVIILDVHVACYDVLNGLFSHIV